MGCLRHAGRRRAVSTDWPVIPAKWQPSREGHSVIWVVLHSMEVPLRAGVASSVGRHFQAGTVKASTHVGTDPGGVVRYVPDERGCYGAERNSNRRGWHVEQAGYARFSAEWLSPEGLAMIGHTAEAVAYACERFDLPARMLLDREVREFGLGIVTHAQLTRVFRLASGHWDPGPNYPFDNLLGRARKLLDQPPLVPVPDPNRPDNRFREFPPVRQGSRDDADRVDQARRDPRLVDPSMPVLTLQIWLGLVMQAALHADGVYGPLTRDAVMHFQRWWRDRGLGIAVDGVCGPQAWSQLDAVADIQSR